MGKIWVLEKELVESSTTRWYHPYIHSNPRNFDATQEAHYRGFHLQETLMKTRRVVSEIFKELTKYYTKREAELQELSGLSRRSFKTKIGKIVQNVRENYYNEDITGIPSLDEYFKAIGDNDKARENFLKNKGALSKATQAWVEQQFKPYEYKRNTAKFTKGELKSARTAEFQSKAVISLKFVENYLKNVMGPDTPDKTFDAIMEMVLTGQMAQNASSIKSKNKKILKAIQTFTDEEWSAISEFTSGQSPTTAKGKTRREAGGQSGKAQGGSYFAQMARTYGSTLSELSAARLVGSLVRGGMSNVVGTLDTELTGRKNKEVDISDFLMTVKFSTDGKPFKAGVDVKFTTNPKKAGVVYSRSGSKRKRFVNELEPLFVDNHLKILTYLLTNLYFHRGESDATYTEYFEQITSLIELTGGLRTLLPTRKGEAIDFANPASVKNLLVSDQRIFVLLNNELFLMTTFLESIYDSLFTTASPERGSAQKAIMANLSAILSDIGSGQNIGVLNTKNFPSGPFYNDKRKVLRQLGSETTAAYSSFKSQVSDPLIGNKISRWKYVGINIPLQIKGA